MQHDKRRSSSRALALIFAFALAFSLLPPTSAFAENTEPTESPHHLAFASDRHSDTSAIGKAMASFDGSTEYACLIGDMVGTGNKASKSDSYNTSSVVSEVSKLFERADVDIVWGTHDKYATDDAGVMFGEAAGDSGLIYTGHEADGTTVAYYVYGIAYYDMSSADNAKTAANAFKSWVDGITDKTIPIFVVCHMPMHYKRGDNKGGATWSRALNYAATQSETGTDIIRNVVFLHGHNHTVDATEYYYAPGSKVTMQDSSGSSSVDVAFTYLTAGYLKANGHATQVTLTDSAISFNRSGTTLGSVTRVHMLGAHHAAQPATCTEDGNVEHWDCAGCDEKLDANAEVISDVAIAALGHDYDSRVEAPTCTEGGCTIRTCTRCQLSYVDSYVDEKGHTFNGMWCADCGTHLGDVNDNGRVNTVDAQITLDMSNCKYETVTKAIKTAADVNADDAVDAVDARAIQYFVFTGSFGEAA